MELPTWILVIFLSCALLLFLVLAIILLVKLIGITKEVKKIIITSQGIAEKADDIVDNVRDMSSIGGLVKHFVNSYTKRNNTKANHKGGQNNGNKEEK
jgi:biopolymer transport protein ExbB/TolQ